MFPADTLSPFLPFHFSNTVFGIIKNKSSLYRILSVKMTGMILVSSESWVNWEGITSGLGYCKESSWTERNLRLISGLKIILINGIYLANIISCQTQYVKHIRTSRGALVAIEVWNMLPLLVWPHSTNSFHRALLPAAPHYPMEPLGSVEPSLATIDVDNLSSLLNLMILNLQFFLHSPRVLWRALWPQ